MKLKPILGFAVLVLASCAPAASPPPAAPAPAPAPATPAPAPAAAEEPVPALRLPSDTRPTAEAIELHIDPKQDRFSGVVDIDVQLEHARGTLWLHGKDMHVTAATVTPDGAAPITATWAGRDDSGFASLTLQGTASPGKARIHLVFDAPFSLGSMGLYKSTEAGVPYAFTQFESTFARLAFPCFDEPGFKIPFTTTLVVPSDLQAISNAREVGRAADGGSVRVSFAPTQPLGALIGLGGVYCDDAHAKDLEAFFTPKVGDL